jgi:hypothetical protein
MRFFAQALENPRRRRAPIRPSRNAVRLARMITSINLAEPDLWARTRAMFARACAAIGEPAAIAANAALNKGLRRRIIAWLAPLEHIVRKLLIAEACALHCIAREAEKRRVRVELVPLRGLAMHWHPQHTPSPSSGEGAGGGVNRNNAGGANAVRASGSRTSANCAHSHPSSLHPIPQSPPLAGRGGASAAPSRSSARTSRAIDLARPESWRAKFAFAMPRDPRFVPDARAPRIRALWGPDPAPEPEPPPRAPRILRAEDAPFRLARRFEALRRVLENPAPYARKLAQLLARAVERRRCAAQRYVIAPARTDDYDPRDHRLRLDAMGAAFLARENAPFPIPADARALTPSPASPRLHPRSAGAGARLALRP